MSSQTFFILPSEKGAERKSRGLFEKSEEPVLLGESVFSLPHFVRNCVHPSKPVLKRNSERHLIAHCLKKAPLRYFKRLKNLPGLSKVFFGAIREMKRYCLQPDELEKLLAEGGSLREYDLLLIFRDYEALKNELGFLDEEDLYFETPTLPIDIVGLTFENFTDRPPALAQFLKNIAKKFPKTKITFNEIPDVAADKLSHVRLFSLPTPFQETDWFVSRLVSNTADAPAINRNAVGILTEGQNSAYEALFQKLKNLGMCEDPSPFLSWVALPDGRRILDQAGKIEMEEAPLEEWMEALREIHPQIESLLFQDSLLNFGKLSKREWLLWLKEALDENPEIKTSRALEGLQWLSLTGGDFPKLEILWVPLLLEGTFPALPSPVFFQEKRDRVKKEWGTLCEAFPEPKIVFEKKRKAFLWQLAQTSREVWLTYPRIGSLGEDLSPFPFTWDFDKTEVVGKVEPLFVNLEINSDGRDKELKRLEKRIGIEEERSRNHLETGEFHTRLDPTLWREKIAPLREEHIFSPSQLETYAQCPFKYFAGRVWNIPQKKGYAPEVDPDDRGTLFHDCLEKFLKENGESLDTVRLDPSMEEEFFGRLEETVENVFLEKGGALSYANPELYRHLKEKTFFQGKQLLENELAEARKLSQPLQPAYFEWTFGTTDHPPLTLGDVRLGGRIDRIDIEPGTKNFLVLDYKTGNISKFRERRLQGLALQLPLYILAVRTLLLSGKMAIGGLLITVKTGDKKTGLVDSSYNETHFRIGKKSRSLLDPEKFEQMLKETVDWVQKYAEQIRSGFFSAQPKECKTSCDYKEICRYAYKPND